MLDTDRASLNNSAAQVLTLAATVSPESLAAFTRTILNEDVPEQTRVAFLTDLATGLPGRDTSVKQVLVFGIGGAPALEAYPPGSGSGTTSNATPAALTAGITAVSQSNASPRVTSGSVTLQNYENSLELDATTNDSAAAFSWAFTSQPPANNGQAQFNGGQLNPTSSHVTPIGVSAAGTYVITLTVTKGSASKQFVLTINKPTA